MRRILLTITILCMTTATSAQSAWLSAWGGVGVPLYNSPTERGSERVMGIRFGPDVGARVRFMLGLELRDRRFSAGRASLFVPTEVETFTYRSNELRVQLLCAVRLAGAEKHETRLVLGLEFGESGSLDVERSLSGAVSSEPVSATVDTKRTVGGFRLGLRHARVVHGPLWWFVEPWADLAFDQQPAIASPWPYERYLELPERAATIGIALGLELGPRSAPRP